MKILMSSHFFHPSVGGIEEVSRVLALELVRSGQEVRIITSTRENGDVQFPFEVIRAPGARELIRQVRWCDVYFHNNISLRTAWPLLFVRRPWVVAHHTWIMRHTYDREGWRDKIKHHVIRMARNIAISEPVARHVVRAPSVVIGNPYRDDLFRELPGVDRNLDLVFLGRLVVDKGVDLLLAAMALMKTKGAIPNLTIIGDGPEREALERQAEALGITSQVTFAGTVTGEDLVLLLNRHKLVVIPSRWQEPFGLAALEAVACGCVAVVADCGGLPDAIGPCGVLFKHEDIHSLAERLEELMLKGGRIQKFRVGAEEHLRKHLAENVAARYLSVLQDAARS